MSHIQVLSNLDLVVKPVLHLHSRSLPASLTCGLALAWHERPEHRELPFASTKNSWPEPQVLQLPLLQP